MDLKEQLARQSLLLQFIAECASLASIPLMLGTLSSQLRWIVDCDACSVVLPREEDLQHWSMLHGGEMLAQAGPGLPPGHRRAMDAAMAGATPVLADAEGSFGIALPLAAAGKPIGALCVSRSGRPFSQGDMRQLQHACGALSAAAVRIVAAQTERRAQREVERAEARMRALAEDRALFAEQMIGIVSHDLRNPLSSITTGAALLARGEELPPQKARVLESVAGAARRARRMVDDLMDFTLTRVGRGLQVDRAPIDLHEVVAHSIDELALAFESRTLRHVAVGPGQASADPYRIAQALGNLVANAAAYGDPAQSITVTSRIDAGQVSLQVHNGGPPIPAELQDTIFEPMVRGAANSGTRSVGLGLFIVRAIAQAHGGGVRVASSPDEGTSFTVAFPA